MTREEAVRRIERTIEEKLIELDLSGLELEELPSEISKCTQLETLLVGKWDKEKAKGFGNKLTEFPNAVFQLTNLKILDLSENQITSIPKALGQMSNLRELDLRANQITCIPEALGQLSNLETLYIDGKITSIPEALKQLPKLLIYGYGSENI